VVAGGEAFSRPDLVLIAQPIRFAHRKFNEPLRGSDLAGRTRAFPLEPGLLGHEIRRGQQVDPSVMTRFQWKNGPSFDG
jgi:hypothetical protein